MFAHATIDAALAHTLTNTPTCDTVCLATSTQPIRWARQRQGRLDGKLAQEVSTHWSMVPIWDYHEALSTAQQTRIKVTFTIRAIVVWSIQRHNKGRAQCSTERQRAQRAVKQARIHMVQCMERAPTSSGRVVGYMAHDAWQPNGVFHPSTSNQNTRLYLPYPSTHSFPHTHY